MLWCILHALPLYLLKLARASPDVQVAVHRLGGLYRDASGVHFKDARRPMSGLVELSEAVNLRTQLTRKAIKQMLSKDVMSRKECTLVQNRSFTVRKHNENIMMMTCFGGKGPSHDDLDISQQLAPLAVMPFESGRCFPNLEPSPGGFKVRRSRGTQGQGPRMLREGAFSARGN